jgi:dihydropyrimidinase
MLAAMTRTLIKGGTIVTAVDTYAADLAIEGEKIAAIFAPGSGPAHTFDVTIDATGKFVMPGGIDAHTHLDMPFGGTTSSDDFETGTLAAAYGGTTSIVDFAIQTKGDPLQKGLDVWHQKAEGKAAIDYAFHMIMTDVNDHTVPEMQKVVDQGVTSFKMFMAYPGVLFVDDGQIFRGMQRAGEIGALICMHAENGIPIDILVQQALAKGHTAPIYHALTRPQVAEAEGTFRAICLAEMANTPVYMVHLSAERALKQVVEARDRGLPVFAETCPQYLFLSYDNYEEPGFDGAKYVMSPPLRAKGNEELLWQGLKLDDLALVSTDHCPFCMKDQKELGIGDFTKIPNGIGTVEHRMNLIYQGVVDGKLSLARWVETCSTTPARLFGMHPRKGVIAPGSDADIVVYDPAGKSDLGLAAQHMNMDYSAWEGFEIDGAVDTVLSRGSVVLSGGTFRGRPGHGRFVRRGLSDLLH